MSDSEVPASIAAHYEYRCPITSRGIAEAYLVLHRELDELRLVKVLRSELATDSTIRERFKREARAGASYRHPNIARVHDFSSGADEEQPYLVMEYIDGTTIEEMVHSARLPPIEQAFEIALQILAVLSFLHGQDATHRDIASDNFMIIEGPTGPFVTLINFGSVKPLLPEEMRPLFHLWSQPESAIRAFRYASPEQLEGKTVGPASDIYSFGVVLYELLTGQFPFPDTSPSELWRGHFWKQPRPFEESDPRGRVPVALRTLVLQCLAKNPQNRPRSAKDLERQLRLLRDGLKPERPTATLLEPAQRLTFELVRVVLSSALRRGRDAALRIRRGRKALMIRLPDVYIRAILVLSLILATAAVIYFAFIRGPRLGSKPSGTSRTQPATTAAPITRDALDPEIPATAVVEIRSNVWGDGAFLDGRALGPTPQRVTVEPGRHLVEVQWGDLCRAEQRWIDVHAGEPVRVDVEFPARCPQQEPPTIAEQLLPQSAPEPTLGSPQDPPAQSQQVRLEVEANTPDALVLLDDVDLGSAPLVAVTQPGRHRVEVRWEKCVDGPRWVDLEEGKDQSLRAEFDATDCRTRRSDAALLDSLASREAVPNGRRIWTGSDTGRLVSWIEAKLLCHRLALRGFYDWELPTLDELASLYRRDAFGECRDRSSRLGPYCHVVPEVSLVQSRQWSATPIGDGFAIVDFAGPTLTRFSQQATSERPSEVAAAALCVHR